MRLVTRSESITGRENLLLLRRLIIAKIVNDALVSIGLIEGLADFAKEHGFIFEDWLKHCWAYE